MSQLTQLGPWSDVSLVAWPYVHFSPYELRQRNNGLVTIHMGFLQKLVALRKDYGKPMKVTSYYRSPVYNAEISATKSLTGPHTTGRAIDIMVARKDAYRLTYLAMDHGFTGIGWDQRGGGRYIHIDDLPERPGQPRPTVWSY